MSTSTIFLQCKSGRTPLHLAALHGQCNRAQTLQQYGQYKTFKTELNLRWYSKPKNRTPQPFHLKK